MFFYHFKNIRPNAYPENMKVAKKLTRTTLTQFGCDIFGKWNIRQPQLDLLVVMEACYLLPAI